MTEYAIAQASNTDELLFVVREALDAGWKLQGGIAVVVTHHPSTYSWSTSLLQAMVREINE